MHFCDRCGQNLMWTRFRSAKIHYFDFSHNYCERSESHGFLNRKKESETK